MNDKEIIKERVAIWLAKDKDGNLVNILEAEQGKDYYCLECGEILRARAKESEKVTPHFYHLNNSNCGGGINESEIHKYFKANLFHKGDIFIRGDKEYQVLYVELEHLFLNEFGTTKDYKPDITLIVKNIQTGRIYTICVELYYTNAKDKQEYNNRWTFFYERGDFKTVFEIDLNQLEFNSDYKEAMEIAEILFPSEAYKVAKNISKDYEEIEECEAEICNVENELARVKRQCEKAFEKANKDIECNKSYYEEELRKSRRT